MKHPEPRDNQFNRRAFIGAATTLALGSGSALAFTPGEAEAAGGEMEPMLAPPKGLDICYMDATELAANIRKKKLSAVEVMTAYLDRIEAVNPKVNAIVSMVSREEAMAMAKQADADLKAGKPIGKLHGMPWAVKDTDEVKGMRSTQGSPILKDNIPAKDSLMAGRLRAAGALIIGKTNVPEFGAGSHTFNPVFGPTRNPYDLKRTCGGSTGGGAVAVATGMLPFTDGADTGGSCRNPGSWNGIIGFRTSMGRIPIDFPVGFFLRLPSYGPMARTAKEAGYLLSVMAGPSGLDPVSLPDDPAIFAKRLDRNFKGTRIAWTPNLGYLPVEPVVVDTTIKAVPILERMGCIVENAHPEMPDVFETNRVLRGTMFAVLTSPFFDTQKNLLKETVIWEANNGRSFSGMDIAAAEAKRSIIFQNVRKFLEKYEFLVLPASQVAQFPIETEYPTEINGQKMRSYLEWMEICYAITLTGLPAISVPCGFTPSGMPLGLQIVGRKSDDLGVLQLAHAFEKAVQLPKRPPLFS
jgi:amidase